MNQRSIALATLALAAAAFVPGLARAQDPFLGEIRCFGFNFAPRGWALLDGQLLPINQNQALFALLGTQYGGDGRTTFALPDMRGRSLVHFGQGPGLSQISQGERAGAETQTLSIAQLPPHTHQVAPLGSQNDATAVSPQDKVAASKARTTLYAEPSNLVAMAATTSSAAGAGQPLATRSPYVAVNCSMALQGIFPSRN
jgi:microcystin-dependent protein